MSQNATTTRHHTLFDRILALGSQDLASVESHVTALEAALPAVPGTTRLVAGATVTERPDAVYATLLPGGPVIMQAPTPDHPADLAKTGGAQR